LKHFLLFSNTVKPETAWFLFALKILEAFFCNRRAKKQVQNSSDHLSKWTEINRTERF